jgi:hypothetical protein
MDEKPSEKQMMDASFTGTGKPNYVDKSSESPSESKFYPNRGQDAPAYIETNPRYWEYR